MTSHRGDAPQADPPVAPARNVAGRRRTPTRGGRRNYSKPELMNFLGIMNVLMPIGGDEWNEVLDRHSVRYPGREVESLRRKFSQLHRKSNPTGDPVCPTEIKLAKRVKYKISSRADIGDGTEEMELETGTFTNTFQGQDDDLDREDNIEQGSQGQEDFSDEEDNVERLFDEVPGEFDAPSVPNNDLHEVHQVQVADDDSVDTSTLTYTSPFGVLPSSRTSNSIAAAAPPGLAASILASAATRQQPGAAVTPSTPTRPARPAGRTPTRQAPRGQTLTPTSRGSTPTRSLGSTSTRPLVSPYDRRSNRMGGTQDSLAKMMEMSMVQHNQYMEVERQRRGEEREDRKAMQDMLAKVVSGAVESFNRYTKNNKDKDDHDSD